MIFAIKRFIQQHVRIITWNVNGIRAVAKKGFQNFVEQQNPDVLCLQETKVHPDMCEPELLSPMGMSSHWSSAHRRGYSGTATFSKTPPLSVEHGIGIRKFDTEGRFVVTDHQDFKLYNVYFPNGGSGPERHLFKQEFLLRFLRHLTNDLAQKVPVILVGDYNIAPLLIDVYDPEALKNESGFLPEERKWFKEFLAAGFIDCFRHFFPDTKDAYTWWSYFSGARIQNRGWRIDHICISKDLLPRLKHCEILDAQEGSDHCPVLIDLE